MKRVVSNALFFMMLLNGIVSAPLFAEENDIPSEQKVSLTEEEQIWLKAHPDIVLGYTDSFEPEVIVNPDGTYRGILVDFIDALNKRLGTRIGLRIDPIPEVLEKAKTKEIDGIANIYPEYADKLGLLKTHGYLSSYPAVFTPGMFLLNAQPILSARRSR